MHLTIIRLAFGSFCFNQRKNKNCIHAIGCECCLLRYDICKLASCIIEILCFSFFFSFFFLFNFEDIICKF